MKFVPTSRGPLHAALLVVTAFSTLSATSRAQIKQPGAHPTYSVELEPHFLLSWSNHFWGGDGVGVGLRASIPVVENGPVPSINNNLAIGFGFDWAHFGDQCWDWGPWFGPRGPRPADWARYDCSGNSFFFPVVAQWNFFFTKVVSVFAEAGLAIEYSTWSATYPCAGVLCRASDHGFDVDPLFLGGGRFLVTDRFGFVVRMGWPYLSAGVTGLF